MKIKLLLLAMAMVSLACSDSKIAYVQEGVSLDLAIKRKSIISFVSYDLKFIIPEKKSEKIIGFEKIGVKLKNNEEPLIVDFNPGIDESIKSLKVNAKSANVDLRNGHIILDPTLLKKGYNEIDVEFVAGDLSLNRNDDYLYTLFVPDRASTAFPCFDQPDLKAKYKLELEIPHDWQALANAPLEFEEVQNSRKVVRFSESDLISTYLFSFVVGKFQTIQKNVQDISMTMLHRETDSVKVAMNVDEIFGQHFSAIKWLEDYTQIPYPFKKFDFVLIPAFQYGGMEHTGAIQYRDSRLFLEESATLDEKVSRSMLIAHETAHMWFGNLVTMKWFDDVWLKEVFANFMASKITEPNFPQINHRLNFLYSHYPQAYTVDRTEGANPIRQKLSNLKNAGSMYGDIIYHKAPIVMRQLEMLLGEYPFREAMREYLENYKGKNANWNDLIEIIDLKTDKDLIKWSKVWVDEPGMPFMDIQFIDDKNESQFEITQYDLTGQNRFWPQDFSVLFGHGITNASYMVSLDKPYFTIEGSQGTDLPQFIQLNSTGLGYGIFAYGLEYYKEDFLFNLGSLDIPSIADDLQRGAAYLTLHEYLLHEGMNPNLYLKYLEEYIFVEENELILSYLLDNLELIYWKFLTLQQARKIAPEVESLLIQKLAKVSDTKVKHLLFKKYISIAQSEAGLQNLMNFWSGQNVPAQLTITEDEFITLAYNIALKSNQITEILEDQIARLNNPDRKASLTFISQALSNDENKRAEFIDKILDPENREHEAWVNTALYYFHHPIKTENSIQFLRTLLDEVEEVQKTGDIFFPKRWLDNILWGYNTSEAVAIINSYLDDNKAMDNKLRQKVQQSADMVFRAERDISNLSNKDQAIQ